MMTMQDGGEDMTGHLILEWENGRKHNLGTIEVTAKKIADLTYLIEKVKMKNLGKVIGWNFIRVGIRILFSRKRQEEILDS